MHTLRSRFFTPETGRCLRLALYWPLFGLLFYYAEHGFHPAHFTVMHCRLDDLIPFCEAFLVPYLFWFVFLIGIHVYTFFFDQPTFQKLMKFIILTYSMALAVFFLYPNCQTLRPLHFPRDNAFTRFIAAFYRFDTSTNVCPSLHVVGSLAVWTAARETRLYARRGWRLFFNLVTPLICISTVFLRQHSVLDLLAGVAVCLIAYIPVYRRESLPSLSRVRRRRQAS